MGKYIYFPIPQSRLLRMPIHDEGWVYLAAVPFGRIESSMFTPYTQTMKINRVLLFVIQSGHQRGK
jgi:hypothetical protein